MPVAGGDVKDRAAFQTADGAAFHAASDFFFRKRRGEATLTKKVGAYSETMPFELSIWCPNDVFNPPTDDIDSDDDSGRADAKEEAPFFEARASGDVVGSDGHNTASMTPPSSGSIGEASVPGSTAISEDNVTQDSVTQPQDVPPENVCVRAASAARTPSQHRYDAVAVPEAGSPPEVGGEGNSPAPTPACEVPSKPSPSRSHHPCPPAALQQAQPQGMPWSDVLIVPEASPQPPSPLPLPYLPHPPPELPRTPMPLPVPRSPTAAAVPTPASCAVTAPRGGVAVAIPSPDGPAARTDSPTAPQIPHLTPLPAAASGADGSTTPRGSAGAATPKEVTPSCSDRSESVGRGWVPQRRRRGKRLPPPTAAARGEDGRWIVGAGQEGRSPPPTTVSSASPSPPNVSRTPSTSPLLNRVEVRQVLRGFAAEYLRLEGADDSSVADLKRSPSFPPPGGAKRPRVSIPPFMFSPPSTPCSPSITLPPPVCVTPQKKSQRPQCARFSPGEAVYVLRSSGMWTEGSVHRVQREGYEVLLGGRALPGAVQQEVKYVHRSMVPHLLRPHAISHAPSHRRSDAGAFLCPAAVLPR
eukprot:TRINITY_DN8660_c0_g1_i1.p1 TRINITY_DN8660_c0_g1~~TRINITY_DN8660_c0_g1_i1.p1  ORF type:complete len:596 (+),score=63.80 TRINITY_DN8660_c0_g1_i1:39-1790(+)